MSKINVDFKSQTRKIKPVNGVGQPPLINSADTSMFSYLKEANIPYSRLHDVDGYYGGNIYVDIPNIFRDFDADPSLPESYDFAFTDLLIKALVENNVEPFFRLGVSIENHAAIRAYRIYPPTDNLKWAKICEGIIRHYTEGWANGFTFKIDYWEIWNEPENSDEINENPMWRGTKEQYYELYNVASKYLKERFPHIKIGGYASSGFYSILNHAVSEANCSPRLDYFITFFDEFIDYIKENNCPFDFFSWHSYGSISDNVVYANYARKKLDDAGCINTETICNEWNCMPLERGTMLHAAHNTAMLIMMQGSPLDSAMFYDARLGISEYGGLFHPLERRPYPLYCGFKAFGELYRLSNEVYSECDSKDIFVLSATDGDEGGILIVNIGQSTDISLEISGQNFVSCQVVTENGEFADCEIPKTLDTNSIYFVKTKM